MVPKPGLSRRGLLKPLMIWAIPSPNGMNTAEQIHLSLVLFASPHRVLSSSLTPS